MKIIYFIFTLIFASKAFSLNIKCNFEEVYLDGSIQQGFFLIKDRKLRYQYYDKNLFTIFHKSEDFFIVKNSQNTNFQKIQNNTEHIKELLNIASQYPNIKNEYKTNNIQINLEPNSQNFFKRISIKSVDLNLSIYLQNCNFSTYHDRYFNFSPYFEFID
mgnify:CR=1 FL=1